MRSHVVRHVPDPFGDRLRVMITLLPATCKPASSRMRPLHIETTWQVTRCSDLSLDVVTRFEAYIAFGVFGLTVEE